MALWATPVEQMAIHYEDTTLKGYFFSGGQGPRPLLILNNGSDGPVSDMIATGVADGVERGYHVLTFDGPGQGYALYEDHLYFRYDWEAVITPVVDYCVARADVDADRVALYGLSQAGYWVPRAAAFEHRLAAIMADPGVVKVGTSWTSHLPPQLMGLLDSGDTKDFDQYVMQGMDADMASEISKRLEPYGLTSIAAMITELTKWDLTDVAGAITAPTWIASPDDEQFWPGQSKELYDLVTGARSRQLVPFTAEEGANWHCEPMAPRVRAVRMFDWLDGVLAQ